MRIKFETATVSFEAEFNETQAAKEIVQNLPISSTASTWGDEIYFDIGVKVSPQGATMEVEEGDIAYWTQGHCLCVFFGPTPASSGKKPVPASPVVIVGKTRASPQELCQIQGGEEITVSLSS
ncbi:MAG: hypothetical protein JSW17_02365 [Candidatus Omnitrophota bacterium]|nr:MAG: hypothetical protein JSW17_02365 [Candidatus Omnitrophota bacterium]